MASLLNGDATRAAGENGATAGRAAAILGIGTANPPHVVPQSTFADYYFSITNSEHMVVLKEKFKRICEKTMIQKRYRYLTDDVIKTNPNITAYQGTSINVRQEMMDVELPLLAAEACRKAIKDWGRPLTDITHLVFCNSATASMPGADYDLVRLLGLPLSTKRFMLYQVGCFGGGTVVRLAKDLAENNPSARVLVVCCEITSIGFRGPCETNIENLVSQALFGDGAGALIIGAGVDAAIERPIFEIVSASQTIIDGSHGAIVGKLREAGLMVTLQPQIPLFVSGSADKLVSEALDPVGVKDLNNVFWVVHPGGAAILDKLEKKLGLNEKKLWASREVLREYGNMSSPSVFFAMEIMRKRSEERGLSTAGEGLEWGVLLGFGPGITAETVVLRCASI